MSEGAVESRDAGERGPAPRAGTSCLPLLAFGVCCLIVGGLTRRFRGGLELQDAVSTPGGVLLLGVLASFTLGSFVLWNRGAERRPLLWAVLVTTALNLVVLALAVRQGWLGGHAFRPHGVVWGLVYGPALLCFLGVPLALYRWLARRSTATALLVYGGIVSAVSAASIPVVRGFVERGVYVFGGGYSLAWDVTWGVAHYALGLGLLVGLERRARAASRSA